MNANERELEDLFASIGVYSRLRIFGESELLGDSSSRNREGTPMNANWKTYSRLLVSIRG